MSVTINAKGTSVSSFTVGKNGLQLAQAGEITPPTGNDLVFNLEEDTKAVFNTSAASPSLITTTDDQDLHIDPSVGGGQFLLLSGQRWPSTPGVQDQVLATNANGVLFWATVSGVDAVTSIDVAGQNGISVAGSPITSSGTITLGLGDITPTSVTSTGNISGVNVSGINTGDQTITLTGDVSGTGTGSFVTTLGTVNSAPQTDTFRKITVNGKGLVTATTAVLPADITAALAYTPVNKAGDTMLGDLILNSNPTQALSAVTKQYVDNVAAGLNVKGSCVTGTTTNLASSSVGTVTYANGAGGVGATLTTTGTFNNIGGVATANGNRILVKNEATTANNGIYVRSSATVLTRAIDFDNSPVGEIASGDFTFISTGTLAGTNWALTTPDPITVGTTGLVFTQLSGAGQYTAGTGIAVSSNSISNTGVLSIAGTTNQITASASTGAITLSLPSAVTISGAMTASSFVGPVTGASSLNVLKAGDTMTGKLNLPVDGLVAGTSQLVLFGGNVGIGVTNPTNKLEVAGNLSTSGTAFIGAKTATVAAIELGQDRTAAGSAYIDFHSLVDAADFNTRLIKFEPVNGSSFRIDNTVGAVELMTRDASPIDFFTNNLPRMRVSSAGNVGIGTGATDPVARLHVKGPGSAAIYTDNGTTFSYIVSDPTNSYFGSNSTQTLHLQINASTRYNINNAGDHHWFNNTTEKMTLDSAGNVGIGITGPRQILDIQRNGSAIVTLQGGAAANQSAAYYVYEGGTTTAALMAFGDAAAIAGGAANTTSMIFSAKPLSTVVNGSERMRIDTAGVTTISNTLGVGGAPFPNARIQSYGMVHSYGDGTNPNFRLVNPANDGGGSLAAPNGTSGGVVLSGDGGPITFAAGGVERMHVNSNGPVLVNTTDPSDGTGGQAWLKVHKDAGGAITTVLSVEGSGDASGGFQITSKLGPLSNAGWHLRMFDGAGGVVGGIYQNTTSTVQYISSSDATMKENIIDAPSASSIVDAINVRSFDWIDNGLHETFGLVAQELKPHFPQAVYEPTGPDVGGKWGVDTSKLVPLLIKEIQELRARVAALELK